MALSGMNGGGQELTFEQRQQFKQQLTQNIEAQLMQGIISSMTDACFKKCVTRPSSSLTGGESTCLAKCARRYADVMKVVGRALEQELTEGQSRSGGLF